MPSFQLCLQGIRQLSELRSLLEKGRQESYRFALMLWKHARVFRRDWSSSISDGCITLDDPVLHRLREINDSDEISRLCMCIYIFDIFQNTLQSMLMEFAYRVSELNFNNAKRCALGRLNFKTDK